MYFWYIFTPDFKNNLTCFWCISFPSVSQQTVGTKNPLALQLMAQGLYNHSTIPIREEEEEMLAAGMHPESMANIPRPWEESVYRGYRLWANTWSGGGKEEMLAGNIPWPWETLKGRRRGEKKRGWDRRRVEKRGERGHPPPPSSKNHEKSRYVAILRAVIPSANTMEIV